MKIRGHKVFRKLFIGLRCLDAPQRQICRTLNMVVERLDVGGGGAEFRKRAKEVSPRTNNALSQLFREPTPVVLNNYRSGLDILNLIWIRTGRSEVGMELAAPVTVAVDGIEEADNGAVMTARMYGGIVVTITMLISGIVVLMFKLDADISTIK